MNDIVTLSVCGIHKTQILRRGGDVMFHTQIDLKLEKERGNRLSCDFYKCPHKKKWFMYMPLNPVTMNQEQIRKIRQGISILKEVKI